MRETYENEFHLIDWKALKRDFLHAIDYDDTIHYSYHKQGVQKVIEVLENRMLNHSATSKDIQLLAFITRNKEQLKVLLEN